jgi:hypothetical protein
MLRNYFGRTRWNHKVTRLKWKLILVLLEIVLILIQDRCTVCIKLTIGSEIIWTHLMELVGDVGHVASYIFPFGDIVSVSAR